MYICNFVMLPYICKNVLELINLFVCLFVCLDVRLAPCTSNSWKGMLGLAMCHTSLLVNILPSQHHPQRTHLPYVCTCL